MQGDGRSHRCSDFKKAVVSLEHATMLCQIVHLDNRLGSLDEGEPVETPYFVAKSLVMNTDDLLLARVQLGKVSKMFTSFCARY